MANNAVNPVSAPKRFKNTRRPDVIFNLISLNTAVIMFLPILKKPLIITCLNLDCCQIAGPIKFALAPKIDAHPARSLGREKFRSPRPTRWTYIPDFNPSDPR